MASLLTKFFSPAPLYRVTGWYILLTFQLIGTRSVIEMFSSTASFWIFIAAVGCVVCWPVVARHAFLWIQLTVEVPKMDAGEASATLAARRELWHQCFQKVFQPVLGLLIAGTTVTGLLWSVDSDDFLNGYVDNRRAMTLVDCLTVVELVDCCVGFYILLWACVIGRRVRLAGKPRKV